MQISGRFYSTQSPHLQPTLLTPSWSDWDFRGMHRNPEELPSSNSQTAFTKTPCPGSWSCMKVAPLEKNWQHAACHHNYFHSWGHISPARNVLVPRSEICETHVFLDGSLDWGRMKLISCILTREKALEGSSEGSQNSRQLGALAHSLKVIGTTRAA
jgi:hypothetical protein